MVPAESMIIAAAKNGRLAKKQELGSSFGTVGNRVARGIILVLQISCGIA